jgi:hypothetical protein
MNAVRRVVRPLEVFQVTEILARDPSWSQSEQADVIVDLKAIQGSTFFALFDFLYAKFPEESFEPPPDAPSAVKPPKQKKQPLG